MTQDPALFKTTNVSGTTFHTTHVSIVLYNLNLESFGGLYIREYIASQLKGTLDHSWDASYLGIRYTEGRVILGD
jgi:hypothetical protein